MRVLVALTPEKSILHYLVPLAWALRTAGHEVLVASQPRLAPAITQAGLTAAPVGRDCDPWRLTSGHPERLAELRAGLPAPYDAVERPGAATWAELQGGMADAVRGWHRLTNLPTIAGLVAFARSWQPDLVLWEPLCFAGPIAAAACGAAHGRLLFGIDVFGATRALHRRLRAARPDPTDTAAGTACDPLADWLAGYGRRYGFGFTEDLVTGQFTVDPVPASLALPEMACTEPLRMQYVAYGGAAIVPSWLRQPPEKPRVAITLGLSATEVFDGYTVPLADVLTAVAGLDVEVVATVAAGHRAALGPLPKTVRVVSYVPWHALAPTCAAIVHHAGAATLLTTARHGVPQLALPFHFDQPLLGRRLAEHGAGLAIAAADITGARIRDAVARLLDEARFRQRAAALCAEIRALPSPNRLVAALEERVAHHRGAAPG